MLFFLLCDMLAETQIFSAPGAAQRQAVSHSLKRGDDYAYYIDLSCSILDSNDQSKKQKPPLGQVTVSIFAFETLA